MTLISRLPSHTRREVPDNFRILSFEREDWEAEFPLLDLDQTVADFINYNQETSAQCYNWEAKFLSFSSHRQRRAADEAKEVLDGQDTLGYPLDPAKRRQRMAVPTGPQPGDEGFFDAAYWSERFQHHSTAGLPKAEASAAAQQDHQTKYPLKGDQA